MANRMELLEFYRGKRVLVTGHTGFKGSWLCETLKYFGADVVGYALEAPTEPNLYGILELEHRIKSYIAPIQDLHKLQAVVTSKQPEIIFHLAAQPLVGASYENPVYTYETNVMGTVNLLECVRNTPSVRSVINVTTDKVYENLEQQKGYVETDRLNGYDPYSNSKACSELVTNAYKQSFFATRENLGVSTVRAGNVIGGGDFAANRIIPDCVRAIENNEAIVLRNPKAVRPYQHVLEPIFVYITLAMLQYYQPEVYQGAYNVGPDDLSCINTEELVYQFCSEWELISGQKPIWYPDETKATFHETKFLKLNSNKLKEKLAWKPRWNIENAIQETVEWYEAYVSKEEVQMLTREQIRRYVE